MKAIPIFEELARALYIKQHQIALLNINPVSPSDYEQIVQLLDAAAKSCQEIQLDKLKQITEAATLVSTLDEKNAAEVKILEE